MKTITKEDIIEIIRRKIEFHDNQETFINCLAIEITELIEQHISDEDEEYKDYCKICGSVLEILDTVQGDNEGIRHDRKCTKCGQIWGCSKGGFHKLTIY